MVQANAPVVVEVDVPTEAIKTGAVGVGIVRRVANDLRTMRFDQGARGLVACRRFFRRPVAGVAIASYRERLS